MQTPVFATSRLEIAGIPVTDLGRRFGTPTYVYDAAMILQRLQDLAAFDHVRYALKACSNLAILDLLHRHGALVDTVSAGEMQRAMAVGYAPQGDPSPLVYTADIFDRESLELCAARSIHVNCGSADMIDQWGARAPGREITLRINPGFGHGHSQKTNTGGKHSKHGIWHEDLVDCLRRADRHQLKVTGIHMHIGSGSDLEHLAQVCGALEQVAGQVGVTVNMISAGGGLPVPYRQDQAYVDLDAYFALWNAARQRLEARFGHPVRLEIEPGRFLVAESGYLVTEIRAVKRQAENVFYLVDAGFNNLARPILYGRVGRHLHPGRRRGGGHAAAARGVGGRAAGDRMRRRLWFCDGLELQLQAVGRRSPDPGPPRAPDSPPADLQGPHSRGIDSQTLTCSDA
jgi:diaminopimelate decarboxylase